MHTILCALSTVIIGLKQYFSDLSPEAIKIQELTGENTGKHTFKTLCNRELIVVIYYTTKERYTKWMSPTTPLTTFN